MELLSQSEVLIHTETWVKEKFQHDRGGHDWWHVDRVRRMAARLAKLYGADLFICELAALLHDVADDKLVVDESMALAQIQQRLHEQDVSITITQEIIEIITTMSFKGGNRATMRTIEGQIVQDADRLDAMGAIGIARTFAYSGWKGQHLYDPTIPPRLHMTSEQYRQEKSTAINHFHEKLLKLSETLNTQAAREIAYERHQYMVKFVERFQLEWSGEDVEL
jgi:uncharacterized protein